MEQGRLLGRGEEEGDGLTLCPFLSSAGDDRGVGTRRTLDGSFDP